MYVIDMYVIDIMHVVVYDIWSELTTYNLYKTS